MDIRSSVRRLIGRPTPMERAFTTVFHANTWQCEESRSGMGSTIARTATIRAELPALLARLEAQSLLDAACGDFNWMRLLTLPVARYVGVDVVRPLIRQNRRRHAAPGRAFHVADITADRLPRCDAVLCRDCLIHLSFADIARALRNLRSSGARTLIATNHPMLATHADIASGGFRTVNLHLPPFDLPAPQLRVIENETAGKTLDVWPFAMLPPLDLASEAVAGDRAL